MVGPSTLCQYGYVWNRSYNCDLQENRNISCWKHLFNARKKSTLLPKLWSGLQDQLVKLVFTLNKRRYDQLVSFTYKVVIEKWQLYHMLNVLFAIYKKKKYRNINRYFQVKRNREENFRVIYHSCRSIIF